MHRKSTYWLAVSAVFLFFFRARSAFTVSGAFDDVCYVQWLYRFLGLPYGLTCYADFYLPGPAIAWIPSGLLAMGFSTLTGTSVDEWIPVFIGISAFAFWAAALWLIDRSMGLLWPGQSFAWSLLMLLAIPVLYYSTVRSCMAHSLEIFLASAIVYSLLKERIAISLLLSFWLAIVRVNDAPMIFVVLARAWDLRPDPLFRKRLMATGMLLAVPLLWIAFINGYGGADYLHLILAHIDGQQIQRTFLEARVGLLWSGPWWLACLGIGLWKFRSLSWMSRTSVAWMALLLLVCIGWTSSGGNLFYRYLIATHVVAMVILAETWPSLSLRVRRVLAGLLIYEAIYLSVITWLHNSRYQNIVDNFYLAQGFSKLRIVFEPLLLIGVGPMGLSAFSWMQSPVTAIGIAPPDYRLSGPSLWMCTVLSLLAVAVLVWTFRIKKGPFSRRGEAS